MGSHFGKCLKKFGIVFRRQRPRDPPQRGDTIGQDRIIGKPLNNTVEENVKLQDVFGDQGGCSFCERLSMLDPPPKSIRVVEWIHKGIEEMKYLEESALVS
jgi:hypothetical protein